MHIARVAKHIIDFLTDVFAVFVGCLATGRGPVEVIAHLAHRGVDVDEIAHAALHKPGAALVEEVAFSVGAACWTADETGARARARDRLRGDKLEPSSELFSGLIGHHRFVTGSSRTGADGQQKERDGTVSASARGYLGGEMLASPPMLAAKKSSCILGAPTHALDDMRIG